MNKKYKVSNYNFFLETNDNHYLLYNSRSGAFASVPIEVKKDIDVIINNPNINQSHVIHRELIEGGFIINNGENEIETLKSEMIDIVNMNRQLKLVLIPTEKCNFDCPYCYLYEHRSCDMEDCVFEGVINLIKKSIVPNYKVIIQWLGGEPTLAHKKIMSFMKELNRLAKENKFEDTIYNMITNGYLLTDRTFRQYLDCGLRTFQITLDGTRDRHNKTRYLKNGKGTFDVIWRNLLNIKKIESKFKIFIRSNFLKDDSDNCFEFIEQYEKAFGNDNRYAAYFYPVYQTETKRGAFCSVSNELISFENGRLQCLEYDASLANKIDSLAGAGYLADKMPEPRPIACSCEKSNSWIVGADGLLYKCDQFISNKDYACGKITPDGSIEINERAQRWKNKLYDENNEKCLACKLLPICQGGCKVSRKLTGIGCFYTIDEIYTKMLNAHKLRTGKYAEFEKVKNCQPTI